MASNQALKLQSQVNIETMHGNFNFATFARSSDDKMPHLALFTDSSKWDNSVSVRVHSECMTGDLFGSKRCECGQQLDFALKYLQEHKGLLIYLRQEGRGIGLINKLKAYCIQDKGINTADANIELGFGEDERTYEDAITILKHFELDTINLLTNNPKKINFLEKEVTVQKRIPIEIDANEVNEKYLKTKKERLGHLLTKV
jgi:GTP cyclohydrolase II